MMQFKKVCCLWLCVVCVTLAACAPADMLSTSGTDAEQDRVVTEDERYKIYVEDGQYYLEFKISEDERSVYLNAIDPQFRDVEFDSLAEMKNDIMTGQFSPRERDHIMTFDPGLIVNPNALLSPVYPENLGDYKVLWNGDWYGFVIEGTDGQGEVNFNLYPHESAARSAELYENWLESYLVEREGYSYEEIRVETESERNATVYYYTTKRNNLEHKDCIYRIDDGDREIYVREKYRKEPGDTTFGLEYLDCYYMSDNQCMTMWTYSITERPSVEWLTSFDLVPYVEE